MDSMQRGKSMKENPELRALAREQLKDYWGKAIAVCFIYSIILGILGSIPVLGAIATLLITGPLLFGLNKFFLQLKRGENPSLETLFDGFKLFSPSLVLFLLTSLFTFLWSLLLIIPGIIAALGYSQAFYILNDNREIQPMEALKLSKEMMQGYKGKLFMLYLSFIGWALLSLLTFGLGFLLLIPYMQATAANFYEDLKSTQMIRYTPLNPIDKPLSLNS